MHFPNHGYWHGQNDKIGKYPRNGGYFGNKLFVSTVPRNCRIPVARNRDAEQIVCKESSNPPKHQDDPDDFRPQSKSMGDEDSVVENQQGGFDEEETGALK